MELSDEATHVALHAGERAISSSVGHAAPRTEIAGCSTLAFGGNSKNRTTEAMRLNSAAMARDASGPAGAEVDATSVANNLHFVITGAIIRALACDACAIGILAMTRANPSITFVRSSLSSGLSKFGRTLAMHRSVCSSNAVNVEGSFNCRAQRAHIFLNAFAA